MNAAWELARAIDPALLFEEAVGHEPDPWQAQLLRSDAANMLLLASRQVGKSTVTACLALHVALYTPDALVLILSPSQRQSSELFKKVMGNYHALGEPVATVQETQLTLTLANGSRVVSLPGDEKTIRGYSGVTLLVIDEAARVPDELYAAVRPMLAVSGGRLIALSTPAGRRGWLYDAWYSTEAWERVRVTADQCPRIPAAFLAAERAALGPRWYAQEYFCSFEDIVGAIFSGEAIDALLTPKVAAVPFGGR